MPENLISATFMMEFTVTNTENVQNQSVKGNLERDKEFNKINILGLCIFSLILGFFLLDLKEKVDTFKTLMEEIDLIIMRVMRSFIR